MVDSAFESWWSILSDPKKIFVIRTHPEELHVLKCITSTHISTNFSQQWGQQMLTKCYPTSQVCSCGFQTLNVWPLGVPKAYRTRSYDDLSILTVLTVCVIFRILWKICGIKHKHKKCWYRRRRWNIIWGCSIRFWNTQRPCVYSLRATWTSLRCWVTLGQNLLTSLLAKISRNMSTSDTFEDV